MSDPVNKETQVEVVPRATWQFPSWVKVALIALGGVSAIVTSIGASGVALPAWLTAVAASLTAICAAFGVGSEGVKVPKP